MTGPSLRRRVTVIEEGSDDSRPTASGFIDYFVAPRIQRRQPWVGASVPEDLKRKALQLFFSPTAGDTTLIEYIIYVCYPADSTP